MLSRQFSLDLCDDRNTGHSPMVAAAIEKLSSAAGTESRGAIFTRSEVVDFILDLAGYTDDQPLHAKRLLEPAFGGGDFLLPVVGRLLRAWRAKRATDSPLEDLGDAIRAVELHRETFQATHAAVQALLRQQGLAAGTAMLLAERWLSLGDFLLAPLDGPFDFVVGNPPYVRQESIPAPLLAEYRSRYQTMYDRADIYIPFIERSLSLLGKSGSLAFICADRWMKNRYGGPLRSLVAEQFHPARRWRNFARQDVDQRRLAGAIGADDGMHGAAFEFERDLVHRHQPAPAAREGVRAQQHLRRLHCAPPPGLPRCARP